MTFAETKVSLNDIYKYTSSNGLKGSFMDTELQEKENGQDAALNRIFLDEILKKLDARERQLIGMRYFKDMTQTEIAAEMGISQVQVSRMEKRILKELKKQV